MVCFIHSRPRFKFWSFQFKKNWSIIFWVLMKCACSTQYDYGVVQKLQLRSMEKLSVGHLIWNIIIVLRKYRLYMATKKHPLGVPRFYKNRKCRAYTHTWNVARVDYKMTHVSYMRRRSGPKSLSGHSTPYVEIFLPLLFNFNAAKTFDSHIKTTADARIVLNSYQNKNIDN